MPMQKKMSAATIFGRKKSFCAAVPYFRISGPLCRSAIQCA